MDNTTAVDFVSTTEECAGYLLIDLLECSVVPEHEGDLALYYQMDLEEGATWLRKHPLNQLNGPVENLHPTLKAKVDAPIITAESPDPLPVDINMDPTTYDPFINDEPVINEELPNVVKPMERLLRQQEAQKTKMLERQAFQDEYTNYIDACKQRTVDRDSAKSYWRACIAARKETLEQLNNEVNSARDKYKQAELVPVPIAPKRVL